MKPMLPRADAIRDKFIREWATRLGVPRFRFMCDDEEINYITLPQASHQAFTAMKHALGANRCTLFIDAYACVGGDTLGAMNTFKDAHVYAIQIRSSPEEAARYRRLQANISEFNAVVQGRTQPASALPEDIEHFLTRCEEPLDTSILYLDPPWAQGHAKTEVSPIDTILGHLEAKVWSPLLLQSQTRGLPILQVLKLPAPIADTDKAGILRTHYALVHTLRLGRRFYVQVFQRRPCASVDIRHICARLDAFCSSQPK